MKPILAAAPHRDVSTLRARGLRNYATFLQIAEAKCVLYGAAQALEALAWDEESLRGPISGCSSCGSTSWRNQSSWGHRSSS
jgi:hypothetical protein